MVNDGGSSIATWDDMTSHDRSITLVMSELTVLIDEALAVAREFLGKGWKFPVGVVPASGALSLSEFEQDIKEAIRIILSTAKGERVMRPTSVVDSGTGVRIDQYRVPGLVESSVREALTRWSRESIC